MRIARSLAPESGCEWAYRAKERENRPGSGEFARSRRPVRLSSRPGRSREWRGPAHPGFLRGGTRRAHWRLRGEAPNGEQQLIAAPEKQSSRCVQVAAIPIPFDAGAAQERRPFGTGKMKSIAAISQVQVDVLRLTGS